jgi:hypothetical protein
MNNNRLNSVPLNGKSTPVLISIPVWVIIFNQQDLCTSEEWINTLTTNQLDLPTFNLVSYKSPLVDNWGVVTHLITQRDLEFEVYIKWDDREDFEDKVQAFKKKIVQREWTLQLKIGSQSLVCTASVTEFKRTERDAPYASTFSLKFRSLDNYTEPFLTQLSYLNTVANFQWWITNEGHRETDLSITMSFTNAVALTQIVVETNWFPLTINQTINVWDVLFIDSVTWVVQLNAVNIDYDWLLPFLQTNPSLTWFNPVEFTFNGWSTVDVNIVLFYTKQFT